MASKLAEARIDYTHALLAPGQGNQTVGEGLEIAKHSEAARAVWEFADQALQPFIKVKLTDIVWNGTSQELRQTEYAQLAVTTASLARAAALLETQQLGDPELGEPGWHGGNSVGFIASLVNAGSLNLEAAVQLAKGRGEAFRYALDHSPKTTMIALKGVGEKIDRETMLELIDEEKRFQLAICLINSDSQIVFGGLVQQVEEAKAYLSEEKGLKEEKDYIQLDVDAAFHSRFMRPAVDIYKQVVSETPIDAPTKGFVVGGATATPLLSVSSIRGELVSQLIEPDRYRDVVWAMRARGNVTTFTELNARPRLTLLNKENFAGFQGVKSKTVTVPNLGDERVIIAQRLSVPWSEQVTRDEIKEWYLDELEKRQDELTRDEIAEGMSFVDSLGLESLDLQAIRARLYERFGRIVPDDEAERNKYIGQGIDATYRLANSAA